MISQKLKSIIDEYFDTISPEEVVKKLEILGCEFDDISKYHIDFSYLTFKKPIAVKSHSYRFQMQQSISIESLKAAPRIHKLGGAHNSKFIDMNEKSPKNMVYA